MNASLEPKELARLDILDRYGILNTPQEQPYDDITRLAAAICNTPMALISFVSGDTVWFKAKLGVVADCVPRRLSLCAGAFDHIDDLLVIPDVQAEGRLSAEVRDAHAALGVRFYAGAKMVSPEGFAVGSVSVADSTPRLFPPEKAEALQALARQVVVLLELRRHLALLRAANGLLAEQSMSDPLTCVPNRRAFDQKLLAEGARAQRTKQNMSLLLIEIDGLAGYQLEYGPVAADTALQGVAHILRDNARPYDYVSRYDDTKFSVILPGTSHQDAAVVASRLRDAVVAATWPRARLTISIGISFITEASDGPSLILAADLALHAAKNHPVLAA